MGGFYNGSFLDTGDPSTGYDPYQYDPGNGPVTTGQLPVPVTHPIAGQIPGTTTTPTGQIVNYSALLDLLKAMDDGSSEHEADGMGGSTSTDGSGTSKTGVPNTPTSVAKLSPLAALVKALGGNGSGLLAQLGGLGISALGTALQSGQISQATQMLGNQAANYNTLGQYGLDKANPYFQTAGNSFQQTLNGTSPWMSLINNGLIPNISTLNNLLPSLMQRNFATESPGIMSALGSLSNNASSGPLQTMLDRATQNVNNGGATANSQNQFQQYQAMQSGATPVMQDLANGGAGLVSSSGMTPQLASALSQVQSLLANGGATGATNALTQRGLQLTAANPLAPMSQILSGAADMAGTREAQAATQARAQAMARGGGPGATVANGVSNQAMADFADQGAQAQAAAVQQALQAQQALQLQQFNSGSQTAQAGQSLEAQRLGELLNSVSNLTATSTGRMGVGGNLLSDYNQGSLGAGSLANAVMTLEMGNQNANMGLINQGVGTQNGMYNSIVSALLGGAQGGANAGNQLGNLYLGNQGQLASTLFGGQQAYQTAGNATAGLGTNWLNFGNNQYSNAGPVVTKESQYAAESPWGQFFNQLGGAAAATQPPTGTTAQPPAPAQPQNG